MVIGMITYAQAYTLYGKLNQTRFQSTTDVVMTNAVAQYIEIKSLTQWPTTQHAYIVCDSTSGNHTAMTLTLLGRNFDSDDWTSISSTIVSQGVDATVPITLTNTTETRWRQFKFNLIFILI